MKSALMCGSSSSSFFVCARVQTMSSFSSSSDSLSFFSSSLSLRHNLSGHTYPKQRTGIKRGTPPLFKQQQSRGVGRDNKGGDGFADAAKKIKANFANLIPELRNVKVGACQRPSRQNHRN